MKVIIYAFLFAILFCSCEDELNRYPKDFLSPEVFETENDIIYALNGTYKALTGMGLAGLDYQNVEPIITDFITDNGFMDKSWMGVVEYWDQRHNQFSQFAERKWARNYMGILRANTVLTYIGNVPMTAEDKARYDAEARFLRAYYYADLVHFYGDVPMRLEPEGIEGADRERTPKQEVIEFIYAELDSAISVLPSRLETDQGRATKGAAQALKAWVALNNYDYSITKEMCDAIMSDGDYFLFHDYAGLFKPANENNSEVIFDIQYMMDKTDEKLTEPWTTYFYAWSSYMADYSLSNAYYTIEGLPANEANPNFNPQKPFENRDPRLYATLAVPYSFNGFDNNGDTLYYIPYNKKAYNFSSLRVNKYVDYDVEHGMRGKKATGTNTILFRYADVLLMKAEALCMTDGAGAEAEIQSLVNEVRQRQSVMMPKVEEVEGSGLSQEQLMDIIKHERRVEFAIEGTRILDIKRWKIGEQAYSAAQGYDPNLLFYWVVTNEIIVEMENDAIVPSRMIRYLKRDSYFLNKIFKSEEAFREQMDKVFTAEQVAGYGDIIIEYVQPKYEVYSFRERSFDASKGYLWPIPYTEIQTNNLINNNNPGY
ncbi:RagB/SusD family nutrient uptake outer membrane protein [Carboxylicivirga sp. RSCT41]|uniref:RagB/SusD family nutrient uptake outer membrane protein n=1 Tax=Carboxylicivirga agarovorans TaxID=3417570 RepID=UPI003D34C9FD